MIAISRSFHGGDNTANVERVKADIFAPEFNLENFTNGKPDALVHLAWQDGFVHNSQNHFLNLGKHFKFINAAAELGIEKITVLGTMHEIGYWEGPITSETPTNPSSMYGIAKDSLRRALFASVAPSTSLRWVRSYYICGDDARNHSIFTKILELANSGQKELPFTSGKNQYDFIDVKDLAQQISVVATSDSFSGTINCCSGVPESLGSKVERFISENKLDISLKYGAYPDREYDSPAVWGDATVINQLMTSTSAQRASDHGPTN